jgi:hypothetical protein
MSPRVKKLARVLIVSFEFLYLIFEIIPLTMDDWAEQSSDDEHWKGSLYKITSTSSSLNDVDDDTYDDAEDHFCYSEEYQNWNTALCNTFRDMSYAEDVYLVFSIISIIFTFCWIILTLRYLWKPTVGVKLGTRGLSFLNVLSFIIAFGTWLLTAEATYGDNCDVNFTSQNRDSICARGAAKFAMFTTIYGFVLAIVYNIVINLLSEIVEVRPKCETSSNNTIYSPIYSKPIPAQPIYSTYSSRPSGPGYTPSEQIYEPRQQISSSAVQPRQGFQFKTLNLNGD